MGSALSRSIRAANVAFPRFGGRLNEFVIVAVGPVGAVGNAQRFPSGWGNRGSDFRRCGSFHGPGCEPLQAAFSWRFAS
jgi:hypothetical protein